MVNVSDLPDLSEWRRINVRDPKLTGSVPNRIRASISDYPDLFAFMNRGIVLSVESVQFDNKTGKLTIVYVIPFCTESSMEAIPTISSWTSGKRLKRRSSFALKSWKGSSRKTFPSLSTHVIRPIRFGIRA